MPPCGWGCCLKPLSAGFRLILSADAGCVKRQHAWAGWSFDGLKPAKCPNDGYRNWNDSWLLPPSPNPPVFHQVFILKAVIVVCFDTLLQVLILKGLTLHKTVQNRRIYWALGSAGNERLVKCLTAQTEIK